MTITLANKSDGEDASELMADDNMRIAITNVKAGKQGRCCQQDITHISTFPVLIKSHVLEIISSMNLGN